MADIIDKIGKYFAEQEAQLRQAYAQHTVAPISNTVYRNIVAPPPPQTDALPTHRASTEHRPPSLLRRRLLLSQAQQSHAIPDTSGPNASQTRPMQTAPVAAPAATPALAIPPLALSTPPSALDRKRPTSPCKFEAAWSEDGFASWRSARSSHEATVTPRTVIAPSHDRTAPTVPVATHHPEVTSSDDESSADDRDNSACQSSCSSSSRSRSATSRKPLLKRKSSIRKKKRRSSVRSLRDEPSAEQLKRENEEKVAAALVLAQERARRIRAERELALKNQELARREEQRRVQDEMDKIEALRRKSKQFALRLRPQSAPSTPGASSLGSASTRSSLFSQGSGTSDAVSPHNERTESSGSSTTSKAEQAMRVVLKPDETTAMQSAAVQAPSFLDALEHQLRDRVRPLHLQRL